jgi:hypothetical protein
MFFDLRKGIKALKNTHRKKPIMLYLDRVKKRLDELYMLPPAELKPCTEEEIVELEQRLGVKLPQAYREYLLWMGHGGGSFTVGTECLYEDLPQIQHWARELLEEDQFLLKLPEDAFVFEMHQGYTFNFFRLSEGDDPPVYTYEEDSGQTSFTEVYPRYSDAMMAWIENHAKIIASIAELRITGKIKPPAFPHPTDKSVEYYLEGLQERYRNE